MEGKDLLQSTDAQVWAKEFMYIFGSKKEEIDESVMIAWFANAIMTGWDHAHWDLSKKIYGALRQYITPPIEDTLTVPNDLKDSDFGRITGS